MASRSAAIGLHAVLDHPPTGPSIGADANADAAMLFPLGHWLQFTPSAPMSELGPDGHPRLGDFMPPLDRPPFNLPRRMWAGSKITFHSPIIVGQQLERTTTIASLTPKQGASGRLCFVVLRHDISADGQLAIVDRHTIVYREQAAADPTAPSAHHPPRPDSPLPEGWDWVRTRRPTETTLFRYSALTFNSHRIHYDLPYATGVEGYPGLVVHGPLLATYLVDGFLQARPHASVTAFEFSARAPIFAGEQLHVAGKNAAPGEQGNLADELAVIGPGGVPAITGRIEYVE
ncbi:FAS1-like dehydratase domain-containing protein [Leucobacter sp. GX24907]